MYGLDMYWGFGGSVFGKQYKYRGPGITYNIVALEDSKREYPVLFENSKPYHIKLKKDEEYILGLDMSTTQSGLAIFDSKTNLIAMIDLINQELPNDMLYDHIRAFFESNFRGVNFKAVIIEEQIKTKNGRLVFGKLSELQGAILGMGTVFGKSIDRIKPAVWRKHFLRDSRYDGRRQGTIAVKIAAGEEVCQRYSDFEAYVNGMKKYSKANQAYICDSCDAVGVACGYIRENYGKDVMEGIRLVSHTMQLDDKHKYSANYHVYNPKTNEVKIRNTFTKELSVKGMDEIYKVEIAEMGLQIFKYNPSMKIEENIRRCTTTSNNLNFILVEDGKANNVLQWETGDTLEKGEIFLIVCNRDNFKKSAVKMEQQQLY